MKISGLCKCHEHDACPESLYDASGKRFRCTCACHIDFEAINQLVTLEDGDFYEYE